MFDVLQPQVNSLWEQIELSRRRRTRKPTTLDNEGAPASTPRLPENVSPRPGVDIAVKLGGLDSSKEATVQIRSCAGNYGVVKRWLERIGLDGYIGAFEALGFDDHHVENITKRDLDKLGVKIGHRKVFWSELPTFAAMKNLEYKPMVHWSQAKPLETSTTADEQQSLLMGNSADIAKAKSKLLDMDVEANQDQQMWSNPLEALGVVDGPLDPALEQLIGGDHHVAALDPVDNPLMDETYNDETTTAPSTVTPGSRDQAPTDATRMNHEGDTPDESVPQLDVTPDAASPEEKPTTGCCYSCYQSCWDPNSTTTPLHNMGVRSLENGKLFCSKSCMEKHEKTMRERKKSIASKFRNIGDPSATCVASNQLASS